MQLELIEGLGGIETAELGNDAGSTTTTDNGDYDAGPYLPGFEQA